jgi:hypothetical protein
MEAKRTVQKLRYYLDHQVNHYGERICKTCEKPLDSVSSQVHHDFGSRFLKESQMCRNIDKFFDLLELINRRLPILHHFLVNLALLGLLVLGIHALFVRHP